MKKLSLFLIVIFLSLSIYFIYSQDTETWSTEGEVVSVSSSEIEIIEYDDSLENDIIQIYFINSQTEIIGVDTINEIIVGQSVEIVFIIDASDNFIAKTIYIN